MKYSKKDCTHNERLMHILKFGMKICPLTYTVASDAVGKELDIFPSLKFM